MAAFASYTDLENRLGITLTAGEQTRAGALLTDASNLIRGHTRQDIEAVSNDVLVMRGVNSDRIRLPQRPVTAVDSVVAEDTNGNQETVDTDAYYLDGSDLVLRTDIGGQSGFGLLGGWFGPGWELTITYDHGYATIPGLAKSIAVEMVARVWVNPETAAQANIAGAMFSYTHQGLLLTEDEKQLLTDAFVRGGGTNRTINLR